MAKAYLSLEEYKEATAAGKLQQWKCSGCMLTAAVRLLAAVSRDVGGVCFVWCVLLCYFAIFGVDSFVVAAAVAAAASHVALPPRYVSYSTDGTFGFFSPGPCTCHPP